MVQERTRLKQKRAKQHTGSEQGKKQETRYRKNTRHDIGH